MNAVEDRVASLPTETLLTVASLLDTKDIVRFWRVSKRWNEIFRSEELCKPALKAILEDTCPNFVADRSIAEQLAYHGRRLQRFYDFDPCGTTKINLGDYTCASSVKSSCIAYHDGRIAWTDRTDESKEYRTRINVRSILDGFILRREPHVPVELDEIGLSSRLVAVTSKSMPSEGDGTCFVWNIDTGEERSFRLFSFTNGRLIVNDGLVVLEFPFNCENKFLIWNSEQEVSYVIDLQFPRLQFFGQSAPKFFFNGNNIYQFGFGYCNHLLSMQDKHRVCIQHDEDEMITTFYCAKFSIADGSLSSYHSKTIRQAKDPKLFTDSKNFFVQADREGLVNYCLSLSDSKRSSLQSRLVLEDEVDYPVLLALFQYDTNSDQVMIRQQERVISTFFIESLAQCGFFGFNWKDIVLIEEMYPETDVTLRAQLGDKNESELQVLNCRGLDGKVYKGRLLSVNDLCTVGRWNNYIVTHWFDQLAYEKARRLSDDSDPESDVNG